MRDESIIQLLCVECERKNSAIRTRINHLQSNKAIFVFPQSPYTMRFLLLLSLISQLQLVDCWSSQLHHSSLSRIIRLSQGTLSTMRLRAERPSTTEETESEDTFFFPWSKSSSHMESQVELLDKKNGLETTEDDNLSSSIAVGGLLATVGLISAVGYTVSRDFDLR